MTINKEYDNKKLDFLILFRAIAAALVVIFHLFILEYAEPLQYVVSYFSGNYNFISNFKSFFNLGLLAVGLFFLVSGFIIPVSLEKYGSKKFIIQRFFRLYPVFITCLPLYYLFVYILYSDLTGIEFTFKPIKIMLGPILNIEGGFEPLDGILWTIRMEWKFYFQSAIIFYGLKRLSKYFSNYSNMLGNFSIIHLIVLLLLPRNAHFMMLLFGLLCFLFYKKRIDKFVFALGALIFLQYLPREYFVACILWLISLFFEHKIKTGKIISFFADISYPLYLIHPIGYFCMSYLIVYRKVSFFASSVITILLCIAVSYLMTRFVEKKFILIGKKFRP